MTWENIRQENKLHQSSVWSVLFPLSFKQQLAPAVQVFCRSGADGGAEALKRKPSALFSTGTSHCCSPAAQEMLEEMLVRDKTCPCVAGRRFVK